MSPVLRVWPVVLSLGLALLGSAPAVAKTKPAQPQEVKPTHEWSGSVADESLLKEAPAGGVVTDEKTFTRLWGAWKLGETMPMVDFKKDLVVVEPTSGSRLHVSARLTAKGDLQVLGLATRDFRPGFRYQVLVLPREGVRTVNGKELPGG